ncbi:MAG TPA: hypothetical protein VGB63_15325 [Pedobacter sp.]|jgi:hypothetical protein
MVKLSNSEKLKIYTKYIGQMVILKDKDADVIDQVAKLTGINSKSIQVTIHNQSRWIPLYDDFEIYEIILLLKPLKMLTEKIKQTANNLPVQNFITQYYIQLGFDMPMFFSPDHPDNCKYVAELGLATYEEESVMSNLYA